MGILTSFHDFELEHIQELSNVYGVSEIEFRISGWMHRKHGRVIGFHHPTVISKVHERMVFQLH